MSIRECLEFITRDGELNQIASKAIVHPVTALKFLLNFSSPGEHVELSPMKWDESTAHFLSPITHGPARLCDRYNIAMIFLID